jgi:hypothetical protein
MAVGRVELAQIARHALFELRPPPLDLGTREVLVAIVNRSDPRSRFLPQPVTKISSSMPAARASSTAYWISGLSTTGSISFGIALVAGRNRVPNPPTGNIALRSGFLIEVP